jgi:hypothetical protein
MSHTFNEHQCDFCMTEVHSGASVCANCGAYKGVKGEAVAGIFWMIIAGLGIAAFGGWAAWVAISESKDALVILKFIAMCVAGAGFTYLTIWQGSRKTWLRRN